MIFRPEMEDLALKNAKSGLYWKKGLPVLYKYSKRQEKHEGFH